MQSLIFYYVVFSISLFLSYYLCNVNNNKIKLLNFGKEKSISLNVTYFKLILSFLPIFVLPICISGFRYSVGTDFENYYILYNNLKNADINELFRQTQFNEPLYVFFNKLAGIIFMGNDMGIFFLSAIVIFFLLFKTTIYFNYRYQINITFSIFIFFMYFFPLTLNIQRQMIAISIILFAYTKLVEKKYISFLFLVFIAVGFHTSSILAILFLPIMIFIKQEKVINLVLIFSSLFIGTFFELLSKIAFFGKYVDRYQMVEGKLSLPTLFEILFFLVPLFLNKKLIEKKYDELKVIFPISLVSIPLLFLSSYQHWFGRTIYFITILQVVIIPLIIKIQNKKSLKIFYFIFYLSYFIGYFYLKFYIVGTEEIFPYQTKALFLN